MIQISLNGETTEIPLDHTLADIVASCNPDDNPVAAAVNGEFVPRGAYRSTRLQAGDTIDLVSPVGGG